MALGTGTGVKIKYLESVGSTEAGTVSIVPEQLATKLVGKAQAERTDEPLTSERPPGREPLDGNGNPVAGGGAGGRAVNTPHRQDKQSASEPDAGSGRIGNIAEGAEGGNIAEGGEGGNIAEGE
jgi:hypothetical protein